MSRGKRIEPSPEIRVMVKGVGVAREILNLLQGSIPQEQREALEAQVGKLERIAGLLAFRDARTRDKSQEG